MDDIAVKVTDLRRNFGDFTAVDGISLEVRKCEIYGFLGPNGAGKSTTIKMLCGLLLPTGGCGSVGGFDIVKDTAKIKSTIGYMSQRFSLYDDLTVAENINFYGGIYGVTGQKAKARVEWILETAQLAGYTRVLTGTLPIGFKQRLALGCALIHEPPILFLDEPTSGVDPILRRRFWGLIHDLSQGGTTVFVTTHYMDEAEYCGRLAFIYQGRLIAEGSADELKIKHMARDVYEVEVEGINEAMNVLDANGIETSVFGSVLHCTVAKTDEAATQIEDILRGAGIVVRQIQKIPPSLEDVFVNLIEGA
ncbi:MAG: ABC transporter ATP-binding protein [Nitrospirae bacterium]|nr:ABC transporter ATP-binding protein [Nitrospirota bacterium]